MNYYSISDDKLFDTLNTSSNGIKSSEVEKRIEKYGSNKLPDNNDYSLLKIIISELIDPIVLLLFMAIIISLIVGEYVDAIAIFVIVLVDLILGTYQEAKANNTIKALSKLVPDDVKVRRDNDDTLIDVSELVVGDLVYLESGDKVPADMRIIEEHNLCVDESILTGESISVEKDVGVLKDNLVINDQTNMVFAGTSILTGRAKAIVVGVGSNTEIGKIASSVQEVKEEKSPLNIRIAKFSKQICLLVGGLSVILLVLLISKGMPLSEVLLSVVALAVSAMPEGLPLALTMALTIASNKMAKKNVVAKKLEAVEAMGSCTVIASDKTGTLTVNEQTAKKIVLPDGSEYDISGSGYDEEGKVTGKNISLAKELSLLGVLNNEAEIDGEERIGDSIDLAFLVLGKKLDVDTGDIKILETIPYESQNKYSAVFYEKDGEVYCTIKGSLEVVLDHSSKINGLKKFDKDKIFQQNESLSSDGYRVISLAVGKIKKKDKYSEADIKNLTFMGLVGFIDPIRKEVSTAINASREAGIRVLMVTGDHPLTAFKIAKDLKLTDSYDTVTTSREVEEYLEKGEEEFDKFVSKKIVFSRVTPIEKLKIIESLKRSGEFVSVTGDGVNDVPALHVANVGISMGSGSDIARESSKLVLMDDNFKSIVSGIFEGRIAYANIRKIIFFLMSCGFAEVLFFVLSIMFDLPVPLLAIQLLWLNVVTDGIQDIALSFEAGEDSIKTDKARSPSEDLFDRNLKEEILIAGLSMGLIVFGLWIYLLKVAMIDTYIARGYIIILMIILQNMHAFNCRSEKKSIFTLNKSNPIFFFGVIGSMVLGILMMEVPFLSVFLKTSPIPAMHVVYLFTIGFIIVIVMEIYKMIKWR
ncbi:MAG: HAD-IC family P-type ATPase [Bacilli bacterium]|nr:HAD-IC family P-type ATPase [Bacilli bacterium]